MISVEECKKILLEAGESFTNDEVEKIREFLYGYARIIIKEKENEE